MPRRQGRRGATFALLLAVAAASPAPAAHAAARIDPQRVVVAADGVRAVIARSPFRLTVLDARGRVVLRQVPSTRRSVRLPGVARPVSGAFGPPPPTLYAPLDLLEGGVGITQTPTSDFAGNMGAVKERG